MRQTIPKAVIDNPRVDWNPFTGQVSASAVKDYDQAPPSAGVSAGPEPDTRYATMLANYQAIRKLDPYAPTAPTHMARVFEESASCPKPACAPCSSAC